ncbi:LacI family DNA-binding transcriptional regulator [Streptomyces sp. NPDC050743]|uniref:LacI family DNA-binding transcriptional regulator n=1 Tax=Streptomyces sp. NPDC050743 TaxID=3365634 RepID=UPI00378D1C6D
MGHPFPIREIARQAGLSEATVDRVLNGRGGVRESTAQEVRRAIADLDRQRTQVRLVGRTFMVDIVVQAPERFSTAVRAALEAELPSLHPAVVRSRFHFRETGPAAEQVRTLDRIARRGSQGVILKAPDVPEVTAAVGRLTAAGIPVVTLVTDLPASGRIGYVGSDNRAAGATAAYLTGQWLGDRPGHVLTSLSSGFFRNEEEREMGFRSVMRARHPERTLVEIAEGQGLDATQYDLVRAALERDPEIRAVYSIGGGNDATLRAFADLGRACAVFIAHDLDHDNTRLLREHKLSAVLHHDLRQDMREACHLVMRAHGALPPAGPALPSAIQVVTPYNMPAPTAE